jgi:Lar family restriction alleviation protein
MSALLPCPFCGGEANRSKHFVFCTACHAESDWFGTDAEALAAWNRRAPGYRAGAEAMRERAITAIRHHVTVAGPIWEQHIAAIRALPIPTPEKKP